METKMDASIIANMGPNSKDLDREYHGKKGKTSRGIE